MSALDDAQIKRFIENGFIRLNRAFPRELADEGRELLWRDTGCDPHDPACQMKARFESRLKPNGVMLSVDDREALECGGLDAAFLFLDLSTNRGIGKRRQDRRTPKAGADFDF